MALAKIQPILKQRSKTPSGLKTGSIAPSQTLRAVGTLHHFSNLRFFVK
ncbi:MAG: hypothetical protein WC615_08615 [Mucilaginibacter sp.]|jgi:hypothetical protein